MALNILITGAAGYIGGTLINTLLTSEQTVITRQQIVAVVRTEEQAHRLSTLDIKVACVDLTDSEAITQILLVHDINLVIHCASASDASLAKPLLSSLGKRIQDSGKVAYFIHTSGASTFADKTGWHHGPITDTDPVYDLVRSIETPYAIREADTAILEYALEHAVTAFIVVPPLVYGRGTGTSKHSSFILPATIRTCIAQKAVYKFPEDTSWSAIHVVDLANFYIRLVISVVQGSNLPNGRDGYFFTSAHKVSWGKTLDHLAVVLHAKGLVPNPEADIWPSVEVASRNLGVPPDLVQVGWNSNSICMGKKFVLIDWEPRWDEEKFLQRLDDEVQAVIDANAE